MLVWILQTGEPLHCDEGSPRPMRAMNLANALVARGHKVVLLSSKFYHQEKRHRNELSDMVVINESLVIHLIPSCGYKRNIGLGRLLDHAQLSLNLKRLLNLDRLGIPDVAFVGYPPIETAGVLLAWLKKHNVPSIIDVKDQWPSLFLEPIPRALRPLIKALLFPYFYYGRRALKNASSFSTMSRGYLDWMASFSGRSLRSSDLVVPLTAPKAVYTEHDILKSDKWWNEIGVSTLTNRRFSFVGSFMSVFDFSTIRDAALRFQEEGVDCQFVICGDGDRADEIHSMMQGLNNIVFPGWIDAPKIASLARCSIGSLIPYKNIDNFILNIPNKVIDALAHGLPIITTLIGEVETLVEKEGVGIACNANTSQNMYTAMKLLLDNPEMQISMSKRALALYSEKFSSEMIYNNLVDALEHMAVK